jgi:hypothetical protein
VIGVNSHAAMGQPFSPFGRLARVKRVHLNKEYVILENDGMPLAGVMEIDEFQDFLVIFRHLGVANSFLCCARHLSGAVMSKERGD